MADTEAEPTPVAEEEAPAAEASPAKPKKAKKAAKDKKPAAVPLHPPYATMIATAIGALKERGGSSRVAILKYVMANNKVGDEKKVQVRIKLAIRKMLETNKIIQVKGSFKLPKPEKVEKKPAKKPAAKKAPAKKPAAKKATKKPAAKKATKKPAAKKVAKKPAAKKPAAKKPAAKKPAAKKPAAKKPAAKKTAKK